MNELKNIFAENKNPNRDFLKKLDKNNYLIGFNNGVYDLNKFEFRHTKYDDYISIICNYDWIEPNNDELETMNNLIKLIIKKFIQILLLNLIYLQPNYKPKR